MVITNEDDADGGDLDPKHCAIVALGYRLMGRLEYESARTIQPERELPVSVAGQWMWVAGDQFRHACHGHQVGEPGAQLAHPRMSERLFLLALARAEGLKVLVRENDLQIAPQV